MLTTELVTGSPLTQAALSGPAAVLRSLLVSPVMVVGLSRRRAWCRGRGCRY
jgi:hypothetical protein